jgi:hypothetical protein
MIIVYETEITSFLCLDPAIEISSRACSSMCVRFFSCVLRTDSDKDENIKNETKRIICNQIP